jgi:hypothetical protein
MGTRINFAAGDPILSGDLLFKDRTGQTLGHVGVAISGTEWIVAPNTGDVIQRAPPLALHQSRPPLRSTNTFMRKAASHQAVAKHSLDFDATSPRRHSVWYFEN